MVARGRRGRNDATDGPNRNIPHAPPHSRGATRYRYNIDGCMINDVLYISVIRPSDTRPNLLKGQYLALFFWSHLMITLIVYMAISLIRPIFASPTSGLISDMYSTTIYSCTICDDRLRIHSPFLRRSIDVTTSDAFIRCAACE